METSRILFAAVTAALAPLGVTHAYLKFPPLRGGTKGSPANAYCPQCGNGAGVCGDGGQWSATSDYLNYKGGKRTEFAPGEEVEFEVYLTAHHMGYFEFSICETDVDSSMANPQECFDRHKLKRVGPPADCVPNDERGDCQPEHTGYPERWYLPPGVGSHLARFKIPVDLRCSSCTLQWQWWTANSCQPASDAGCYFEGMRKLGWDADKWCKGFCGSCNSLLQANTSRAAVSGCGEEFRNCADISVGQGKGPSVTGPATTTSPVSRDDDDEPEAEPESEAEAEPEAEPEAEVEAEAEPTPGFSMPSPASRPAKCGACKACLWSHGQCFTDASRGYCELWSDNLWCGGIGAVTEITKGSSESQPAACGSCQACLWSHGQCFSDASKSYCELWSDNLWCGAGSLAQIASAVPEHDAHRHRKTNKAAPAFLSPSLLQDGASVSHAAMSSERTEEL